MFCRYLPLQRPLHQHRVQPRQLSNQCLVLAAPARQYGYSLEQGPARQRKRFVFQVETLPVIL